MTSRDPLIWNIALSSLPEPTTSANVTGGTAVDTDAERSPTTVPASWFSEIRLLESDTSQSSDLTTMLVVPTPPRPS